MSFYDSDPRLTPLPIRLAKPLFEAFRASHHCVPEHRWHARTTLPVLALFLAMHHEVGEDGLPWGSLDPDALMAASLEIDHEELGFLQDLLDVSSAFYGFLGDVGAMPLATADRIQARLATLSMGLCRDWAA